MHVPAVIIHDGMSNPPLSCWRSGSMLPRAGERHAQGHNSLAACNSGVSAIPARRASAHAPPPRCAGDATGGRRDGAAMLG
jgi:hypothetical protein